MTCYIKAEQGLHNSVIYTTDDGKYFRYYGGTWPWRNNNPGDLVPGHVSKRNNQIGVAGGFAVFPDYKTGHAALLDCLTSTYIDSSIDQTIDNFMPLRENPNNPKVKKEAHEKTGIPEKDDKKFMVKDFTPAQFETFWTVIEKWEGYDKEDPEHPRKTPEVYKISKVRKDKNDFISEYYIENMGWITKYKAHDLAEEYKLDVESCISKLGNKYLRARAHSSFQQDFDNIVEKKHER